jgi:general stress protein 26
MTTDTLESREHLTKFLSQNSIGVLATTTKEGVPHAATIYFTFDQQFNIYFITKRDTQKSRNLALNPRAAMAIFEPSTQTTVQAEGTVTEVANTPQTEWIFTAIWRAAFQSSSAAPPLTRLTAGGYVIYKLSAPSIRIATYSQANPEDYDKIFEVVYTQPTLH